MSYRCCSLIQSFAMNFRNPNFTDPPCLSFCCEAYLDIPKIELSETATAEEILRSYVGMGLLTAVECARVKDDHQRHFTANCAHCHQFVEGDYTINALINYVSISLYPSPCQSRCIYCDIHDVGASKVTEKTAVYFQKMYEVLDLAERSGILSPSARWQVSCGEIAIHPYRNKIMKILKGKAATFFTNCMKYDEAIAENLHENPNSAINLSIDAGTPETWKRVKGVDNFNTVLENLVKYHAASARPGQITLKYIVLPGINDIFEDYASLMEIMKVLEVKHLTLSFDVRDRNEAERNEQTQITGAAAYLLAMCHKNGFTNDMFNYSQEDQAEIIRLANEILQKGLV